MIADRGMSLPIKNLFVDLDGTLVSYRDFPLSADFISLAIKALSPRANWLRALRTLRATAKEMENPSRKVAQASNYARAVMAFSKKLKIPQEEGRELYSKTLEMLFPQLERHFKPAPGAAEFLAWANEKFKMVLATNPVWPQSIIKMRLQWAGVSPEIFEFISDSTQMHSCKPSASYYRELLEKVDFDPGQTLLIGNDLKMDLPATRLGIFVFIVNPKAKFKTMPERKGRAKAWMGTFEDLKKLLLNPL